MNWTTLSAEEAAREWVQLDAWVYWLRDKFGLRVNELPPMWHRHDELVWELSALRTAWIAAHTKGAHPDAPLAWLRELDESLSRLREWVSRCSTGLTDDRPTRQVVWPGEPPAETSESMPVKNRAADFHALVEEDVNQRRAVEREARDNTLKKRETWLKQMHDYRLGGTS